MKGAFTGAVKERAGHFQQAHGGTIFLDEFGELPLDAQVRLLRVLQSGEYTPVGASELRHVDVRVIVATNRDLMAEVAKGTFREDRFYRVSVGVLNLPPLRGRAGDIGLLVDAMMSDINRAHQFSEKHKKVSVRARNILLSHRWKGNVRELYATLLRDCLWSVGDEITDADVRQALFETPTEARGVLDREIFVQDNF